MTGMITSKKRKDSKEWPLTFNYNHQDQPKQLAKKEVWKKYWQQKKDGRFVIIDLGELTNTKFAKIRLTATFDQFQRKKSTTIMKTVGPTFRWLRISTDNLPSSCSKNNEVSWLQSSGSWSHRHNVYQFDNNKKTYFLDNCISVENYL